MRTLPTALTTAQQAASPEPQVDVTIENAIAGIRRLDHTIIDQTANTIAKHDVCVPADGSVTRVRSDNAGGILVQRNTSPGSGAGYSGAWTTLQTGRGNEIACAARGTRVVIVYLDAAGTSVKMRESTDSGATFAAEAAVAGPLGTAVLDLAVAYKNAGGDLLVAWVRGSQVGVNKRTGGAFAGAVENAVGAATLAGIAVTYGVDYDMVLTGTEITTNAATVWSYIYGDGGDVANNTFGTLRVQVQAESDALIAYSSPSIVYTDTYRILFLEDDTFTGGVKRVYRCSVHPTMAYTSGPNAWRAPLVVAYDQARGLATAADIGGAGYLYETAPDYVQRAAQSLVKTTLTTDVVAVDVHEEPYATRGHIDIDNSTGLYAGPPAPIAIGNYIGLAWGYNTSSGLVSSKMQDLWLARYEYRRAGGKSVLRLHVEGVWEILARSRQHGQVLHSAESYLTILARVFSRAGIQLTNSSASSRSTTVTPTFTIAADADAAMTVRRALQFLADRIRPGSQASAALTEPLASAASTYTFGASHPLNEAALIGAPPSVSDAVAIGAGAFGESVTYAYAGQGIGDRELQRDQSSGTGAAALATSAAHLRQRALAAPAGQLVAPPHCGAELLDAVDFTDLYISASAVKRRVAALRWRYDRHRAVYAQSITLGAS